MRFLNVVHTVEAVGRLVRASGDTPPQTFADLPDAYRRAIARKRPYAPPPEGVAITFEDGAWGSYLSDNKVFENIFRGVAATREADRELWSAQLEAAIRYVRETFPELGLITDLLVTDVVLLTSQATGGGSASQLPGLVAISPGPDWRVNDFAETIVHEATHLNLFVLDMVNRLYTLPTDELAQHNNRVVSAVKVGELRPFDKAFHSAIVAVPLMYMQHRRGKTDLVNAFAVSLNDCCQGLNGMKDLFTPYGQGLLADLTGFAQTLDFDQVRAGFRRIELVASVTRPGSVG
ncbi:HEXXH motif-containing putative peptide modification protein [Actinocorallia sp. API 0066]|uniref:aKG-HExxH-type peptide beta-hydroxylase n=1 Tax=Actinocorallia sp. API 0066 TaxID=2896846 RepID=UPI001E296E58|nr:HEXXH motif-containing putative peptide modification protein [Actinocorallia sp. API 0066]MCD0447806.1 HEXXH motif-containing putative peptide modification protein [Actinocorallia sp. API 0066]